MAEFDCQKAAENVLNWVSNLYDTRKQTLGRNKDKGKYYSSFGECTGCLSRGIGPAVGQTLTKAGPWPLVWDWMNGNPLNQWYTQVSPELCQNDPQIGDVMNYDKKTDVTGHGVIYLDLGERFNRSNEKGRWISDFIQNGWNCYPGSGAIPCRAYSRYNTPERTSIGAWRLKIPVVKAGEVVYNGYNGESYNPNNVQNNNGATNYNSGGTYVSKEASYTPVKWEPPIEGGEINFVKELENNGIGRLGMVVGVHIRQKNIYGRSSVKKKIEEEVKKSENPLG